MIQLKNCPNCGGILDDVSNLTRVYNRTDATCNIEFNVIEMENQNNGQ